MTTLYETPPQLPPTPKKKPVSSKLIVTLGIIVAIVTAAVAAYSLAPDYIFTANSAPTTSAPPTVTVPPSTVVQQAPPVTVVQAPPVTVVQQAPPTVTIAQPAPAPAPATVYQRSTNTADQQVAADHSVAESTIGWWLPQISSKQDSAGAMERFTISQATYPDVFMVRSNDYSTFSSNSYYVAIVPREFDTAAGANGWCDAQGFTADNCFARRLSHQDGPEGNSVQR